MTADGSRQESDILRQLDSGGFSRVHPEKALIPSYLDEIVVKGPNGEHHCLVTAPACMSLSDAREASYGGLFQLPVARAIAAQLVQAVAFLHSQGIVHAGTSTLYHVGSGVLEIYMGRHPLWQHPPSSPQSN